MWLSRSGWRSSRCSSRLCSTSTATPSTCASCGDGGGAPAGDNRTDVPGVIMFEIDGLGEGVLREAVRDGHAPTIARWLSRARTGCWDGSATSPRRRAPARPGSCSEATGTCRPSAGMRRSPGGTLVSNHPADAAEIERRHATGDGLLGRRGHEPGQHVLRRSAALHGHDERHPRSLPLEGGGPVRLLLRSLRIHAHDRAVARRHRAGAPGSPSASAAAAPRMSIGAASTRSSAPRSRSSCATSSRRC